MAHAATVVVVVVSNRRYEMASSRRQSELPIKNKIRVCSRVTRSRGPFADDLVGCEIIRIPVHFQFN